MSLAIPPGIDNAIINATGLRSQQVEKLGREIMPLAEKAPLDDNRRAELAKVARGFESIFVNMLYKEMKSSIGNNSDSSMTFGKDTLDGYTDMVFTDYLANSGSGIGIAEMVYKQLSGGDRLSLGNGYSPAVAVDNLKTLHQQKRIMQNSGNSVTDRLSKYEDIIKEAAQSYGISESLIKSVIASESAAKNDAVSKAGAKGLMQLMDNTAKELGVKDSFDPYQNIMGGAKYLKNLFDKYDGDFDMSVAAYNAGPGNVDKYEGIPPFNETNTYINRVKKYLEQFEKGGVK